MGIDRKTPDNSWEPMQYETLSWEYDADALSGISKTARSRILPTYEASIPLKIADKAIELPLDLSERIGQLLASLARIDAEQQIRGYDIPSLLLRSESSASSQIENLTANARNIALAELSNSAPQNAKLIAGNIAAMRAALNGGADLSVAEIERVHAALIGEHADFGGKIRTEQVWIGGYPYSPHGALFVPPAANRVPDYLDDIVAFSKRRDINPIAKAAISHAQFETVHPFIDGNGRTGRALLHKMLRNDDVLFSTLPISAGLLHDIDNYMSAIKDYQNGNPIAIVEQIVLALEKASVLARACVKELDGVLSAWREQITERKGAKMHSLPYILLRQPVVDTSFVANELGITQRAALSLVERACEYGMLRPMGNRKRGEFYQSDAIIDVLDKISSKDEIRRVLASGKL